MYKSMVHVDICPHCEDFIIIEKLNCGIFRHGVCKETHKQIDPHLSRDKCVLLIKNDLIYGWKTFSNIKFRWCMENTEMRLYLVVIINTNFFCKLSWTFLIF